MSEMSNIEAYLRYKLSGLKRHAVAIIKHPASARKAAVAALAHVAAMLAAFAFFFPHITGAHAAAFTAVTGAVTYVATFLTSNVAVQVADDIDRAENP